MKWRHCISLGLFNAAIILGACSHQASQSIGQNNQAVSASSGAPSPVPTPTSGKPAQAEQIDKTWPSKFKFETKSINKKHEGNRGYEISVDYPRIADARTPSTRRFNRWISKKIHSYVAEFKGLEEAAEIHDKRKRLPPLGISESLEIDYLVYYSDNTLISLRLTHTVMAMGQMHPVDYYETINYDLRKGRLLHPLDVFRRGYLKVWAEFSRRQLKEQYDLADEWSKRGTMPEEENFKNWNVVPDGILLSFEDYQIGAHSFGQAEMVIPYAELYRVVRDRGIASQFMIRH